MSFCGALLDGSSNVRNGPAAGHQQRQDIRAIGAYCACIGAPQDDSSQVESSRVDWIGLARRRRLAWAKARFARGGGLEMKLQSRAGAAEVADAEAPLHLAGVRLCAGQGIRARPGTILHARMYSVLSGRYDQDGVGKHRAVGTQRRLTDYQSSVRINNSLHTVFSSLCK